MKRDVRCDPRLPANYRFPGIQLPPSAGLERVFRPALALRITVALLIAAAVVAALVLIF